jgi:hypothetical protein
MPKENLPWKASEVKRLFRAVQKVGFANRRTSLSITKDGTLTIEVAAPSRAEVSLDVSRDIDEIIENERAKWGDTDGKDTP